MGSRSRCLSSFSTGGQRFCHVRHPKGADSRQRQSMFFGDILGEYRTCVALCSSPTSHTADPGGRCFTSPVSSGLRTPPTVTPSDPRTASLSTPILQLRIYPTESCPSTVGRGEPRRDHPSDFLKTRGGNDPEVARYWEKIPFELWTRRGFDPA